MIRTLKGLMGVFAGVAGLTTFAAADILLEPGNSIVIGGQRVSCGGQALPPPPPSSAHWSCSAHCMSANFSGTIFYDEGQAVGEGGTRAESYENLIGKCRAKSQIFNHLALSFRRDADGYIRSTRRADMDSACIRDN